MSSKKQPKVKLPTMGMEAIINLRASNLEKKTAPYKGSSQILTVKTPTNEVVTLRKEVLPRNFIPAGSYTPDVSSGATKMRRVSTKNVPEYKKGGRVKKTGVVKLHKGEVVVPAGRVSEVDAALKKNGLKALKK